MVAPPPPPLQQQVCALFTLMKTPRNPLFDLKCIVGGAPPLPLQQQVCSLSTSIKLCKLCDRLTGYSWWRPCRCHSCSRSAHCSHKSKLSKMCDRSEKYSWWRSRCCRSRSRSAPIRYDHSLQNLLIDSKGIAGGTCAAAAPAAVCPLFDSIKSPVNGPTR